jgi:hypothetical protein
VHFPRPRLQHNFKDLSGRTGESITAASTAPVTLPVVMISEPAGAALAYSFWRLQADPLQLRGIGNPIPLDPLPNRAT